jgi:hypothetical protein
MLVEMGGREKRSLDVQVGWCRSLSTQERQAQR